MHIQELVDSVLTVQQPSHIREPLTADSQIEESDLKQVKAWRLKSGFKKNKYKSQEIFIPEIKLYL